MKKLTTLAKGLDFETTAQYFDYLIDSHINGNFSQCKDLFFDMFPADREKFLSYCKQYAEQYEFYLEVQESAKRYKVYKIGRKYGMSGRRQVLGRNLTREEARRMVNRYPDSSRSMVLFVQQNNNY